VSHHLLLRGQLALQLLQNQQQALCQRQLLLLLGWPLSLLLWQTG
jgi:hypothetical protein